MVYFVFNNRYRGTRDTVVFGQTWLKQNAPTIFHSVSGCLGCPFERSRSWKDNFLLWDEEVVNCEYSIKTTSGTVLTVLRKSRLSTSTYKSLRLIYIRELTFLQLLDIIDGDHEVTRTQKWFVTVLSHQRVPLVKTENYRHMIIILPNIKTISIRTKEEPENKKKILKFLIFYLNTRNYYPRILTLRTILLE